MKNKINVDVLVPTINKNFNLFIPVNKTVGEVIQLLNKGINQLTNDDFPILTNLSLVNLDTGVIYDINTSIKNNKILNGARLALI